MSYGLVSVIIPSFNRFQGLLDTIECVNNQTYQNIEIIIVNDGSTQKEYYEYKFQENVIVVNVDRNQTPDWGGSRNPVRNFGVNVSSGKYIAFLDDDDYWTTNKLDVQLKAMIKNKIGFSCTEGYFGYGKYNEQSSYQLYNKERHFKKIKSKYLFSRYFKFNSFPKIWSYDFLLRHNSVVNSSVVVERELFMKLGGFRGIYKEKNAVHTSDHDCWLGLLQLSELLYVDEPLFYYDAEHGGGRNYKKIN